jgi:DNA-binding transcriptional LysR family regulator
LSQPETLAGGSRATCGRVTDRSRGKKFFTFCLSSLSFSYGTRNAKGPSAMNLQQLITFSTVISEGSMTAAAEKLYLTQPAVSQQIRNLEDELGVGLLDRGSRHAKPTVQGQLLYDYAKRIIALTQQAQVAIQTMGEGVKGSLRIGTLNSLGLQLISPAISAFMKHNAKISVSLQYQDGAEVFKALTRGELDVAILPEVVTEYGKDAEGFTSQPLLKDEMWLVASGRDTTVPDEASVADLASRPYMRLTERYEGFEKKLKEALDAKGIKLKPAFETNNVGTLKRAIESGLGWGFLPSHAIRKQVRMGRLTAVDIPECSHSMNVQYYSKATPESAQAIEVFYRALKQQGLGQ